MNCVDTFIRQGCRMAATCSFAHPPGGDYTKTINVRKIEYKRVVTIRMKLQT
eukprot:UN14499